MTSHRRIFSALVLALLMGVACTTDGIGWQDEEDVASSDDAAPRPKPIRQPPDRRVIEVRLAHPEMRGTYRWEAETAGMITGLLEAGLAEMSDVRPAIEGVAVSPGLADGIRSRLEQWDGEISLSGRGGVMEIRLDICSVEGPCEKLQEVGTWESPYVAVATLLTHLARVLGTTPSAGAQERWKALPSADPYARLLCGRAAATFYGLLRSPAPEDIGDHVKDPYIHAILVDPKMTLAWWFLGRRAWESGNLEETALAFGNTVQYQPQSPLFRADRAQLFLRLGRAEDAWAAWQEVRGLTRADPRFTVSRARAAFKAGWLDKANQLLSSLPVILQEDPEVVALRADIAASDGLDVGDLALLDTWKRVDPTLAEPVRRQVRIHLLGGEDQEAYNLLPELEKRGRPHEAWAFGVPLALDLDLVDASIENAEKLEWPDVARRIALRVALTAQPGRVPDALMSSTLPEEVLARAEAHLTSGAAATAVAETHQVLFDDRWNVEALALESRALGAAGRTDEACEAWERLHFVDPLGYGTREPSPCVVSTAPGAWSGEMLPSPEAASSVDDAEKAPITAPGSTDATKQEQSSGP